MPPTISDDKTTSTEEGSPPQRSSRRKTILFGLLMIVFLVSHNLVYGVEVAKWMVSFENEGTTPAAIISSLDENDRNNTTSTMQVKVDEVVSSGNEETTAVAAAAAIISSLDENDRNTTSTMQVKVDKVPRIFHCKGYAVNRNFRPVLESVFPEYEWKDISGAKDIEIFSLANPWDIFVSNWALNECPSKDIQQYLNTSFPGKVLFMSPEDLAYQIPPEPKANFYEFGPGSPTQSNRIVFTFLQSVFWSQVDKKEIFFEPSQRPRNTGKYFLIYANRRCFDLRQTAFRKIANLGLDVSYYGGRCNGGMKNESKAKYYPNSVKLHNWENNHLMFHDFRFCLTMEHNFHPGYITEKILVAFWGGCVPIYYGSKDEIFDIFDRRSFIYYDIDDPQPALDRITYLERNRTAYNETLSYPILREGAIEKYFSLSDEVGGGKLKYRLRTLMGIQDYSFSSVASSRRGNGGA